jgi:hypothetical protein
MTTVTALWNNSETRNFPSTLIFTKIHPCPVLGLFVCIFQIKRTLAKWHQLNKSTTAEPRPKYVVRTHSVCAISIYTEKVWTYTFGLACGKTRRLHHNGKRSRYKGSQIRVCIKSCVLKNCIVFNYTKESFNLIFLSK